MLSSGDLPNAGIEPRSPALLVDSLPAEPRGKQSDGVVVRNALANERDKRGSFHPYLGTIARGKKWQLSLVFLPGKVHGQRSLAGYSS